MIALGPRIGSTMVIFTIQHPVDFLKNKNEMKSERNEIKREKQIQTVLTNKIGVNELKN